MSHPIDERRSEAWCRRRAQRGAAMVEALAAIPFFMLIFASAVYLHDVYRMKISTLSETRRNTWFNALGECTSDSSKNIDAVDNSLLIPPPQNSQLAAGQEAPGGQLCDKKFDETAMVADESVQKSEYMGGGSTPVKSRYKLLCNEKPVPGDFQRGVEFLWNKLGQPATGLNGVPLSPASPL